MIEHAREYAALGWPVFPLHEVVGGSCSCRSSSCRSPGKHPRIGGGVTKATTDRIQIDKWWQRSPSSSIGVATGKPSGLIALDIDRGNCGFKSLDQLISEIGALPKTPTQKTGGDGLHYLFSAPSKVIRNSASKLGTGIDIRGNGGYIVAPPSGHISGQAYQWLSDPFRTPLAPFPDALIERLTDDQPVAVQSLGSNDIPKGIRNSTLTSIAGKLRANGKNRQEIKMQLAEINAVRCMPPLDPREVLKIAESVSRYPISTDSKIPKYQFIDWLKSSDGPDDPNTCYVLLTLTGYMDKNGGSCYPNIEDLVAVSKLSERTVRRHLDKAVHEGWIIRYAQPVRGGKHVSYGYVVPPNLNDYRSQSRRLPVTVTT